MCGFICNPLPPAYCGREDGGYWDEVDRYVNELIVQQMLEEKEKNEKHNNQLQESE